MKKRTKEIILWVIGIALFAGLGVLLAWRG
jgi:hypothetical protein